MLNLNARRRSTSRPAISIAVSTVTGSPGTTTQGSRSADPQLSVGNISGRPQDSNIVGVEQHRIFQTAENVNVTWEQQELQDAPSHKGDPEGSSQNSDDSDSPPHKLKGDLESWEMNEFSRQDDGSVASSFQGS